MFSFWGSVRLYLLQVVPLELVDNTLRYVSLSNGTVNTESFWELLLQFREFEWGWKGGTVVRYR